jgi:hypothetical protein
MRIAPEGRGLSVRASWVAGAAPLLAALMLWGCGSADKSADGGGPAKPGQRAMRKAPPGSDISPNMVSALSGAHTGPRAPDVQVKFELRERPTATQPLDIDLVILPGAVDRVYGRVEASGGLELAEGAEIAPTDRPQERMPVRHSIKVLPKADGIYTMNAVVSVESGGQTSTQTFSFPVIVAAPAGESPAPAAPPATKPKAR